MSWEVIDIADVPARPACYAITCAGLVVYIGQTRNLRERFWSHGLRASYGAPHVYDSRWGTLQYCLLKANFGTRYGDWAMREVRLIRRLRPKLNVAGNRGRA